MSIVLSQQQVKTAGISFSLKSSGFFVLNVLSQKNGIYTVKINNTPIEIKSSLPLKVGQSYNAIISKSDGTNYTITIINSSPTSINRPPQDSVFFHNNFSITTPFESEATSLSFFNFLLDKKVGDLSSGLTKSLFQIQQKFSNQHGYSQSSHSSYLELSLAIEAAKKGLIFHSFALSNFVNCVFPPSGGLPKLGQNLIDIFNKSKNKGDVQWELYPFCYASNKEDKNGLYGSLSLGKKIDDSLTRLRYMNINCRVGQAPTTIHFNMADSCYYLCGDFFKSNKANANSLIKRIEKILGDIGFKKGRNDVSAYFDGFMVLEE